LGTRNELSQRLGRVSGRIGRWFETAARAIRKTEGRLLGGQVAHSGRVLQDAHGIQVFECDPPPVFVKWDLDVSVTRSPDRFLGLVAEAREKQIKLGERERLALSLFSGSFFEP